MNEVYLDTARLLTQVAPFVFAANTFALKGGTAINLFIRDMPRLSVDLDLGFPDHCMPLSGKLALKSKVVWRPIVDRRFCEPGAARLSFKKQSR